MLLVISTIFGLIVGAVGGYLWCEAHVKRQLRQVLAVMETADYHEDISLPMVSQLRRRILISQQQHQQLQQQLVTYQLLLQAAPIGYLQIDAENQLSCCNQQAQQLFQIQRWQPGQTRLLLELVRSYELDRLIAKVRANQATTELVWQFHCSYQEAAKSQSIWLKATGMPLEDGAIGVFIESQQQQVDADTARERWLGDLAHEIRTPLTVIHLLAETLESKVTPDLTRWATKILNETNRSIDLVQHFLELSQLENSDRSLQLAAVDVVGLIDDAWHTLEPIAKQRQIEFVYTGAKQLIWQVDKGRFTQVLINLFDNSLKFCPDRGHIWLDLKLIMSARLSDNTESNSISIDLYDDGSGFTTSDLPYIFDRLYRGDRSRQRQPTAASSQSQLTTGSGLGLAIVRQIILAHHGTIVANNHPTTAGAWFNIALPSS